MVLAKVFLGQVARRAAKAFEVPVVPPAVRAYEAWAHLLMARVFVAMVLGRVLG